MACVCCVWWWWLGGGRERFLEDVVGREGELAAAEVEGDEVGGALRGDVLVEEHARDGGLRGEVRGGAREAPVLAEECAHGGGLAGEDEVACAHAGSCEK